MSYKLSEFIELVDPTDLTVNHIIETKHEYMLIFLSNIEYLVSTSMYKDNSFSYDHKTKRSKLTIIFNGKEYVIDNIREIIGFRSFEVALKYCTPNTDCLCHKPDEKLIFSPQLAKWLLKNNFRIVDIKEKKDDPSGIIPIFVVEDGFYDCIKEWKENKDKKKGKTNK